MGCCAYGIGVQVVVELKVEAGVYVSEQYQSRIKQTPPTIPNDRNRVRTKPLIQRRAWALRP